MMRFDLEVAKIHLDAWGIKRLFTHILRRWLAGASQPRVFWIIVVTILFFGRKCVAFLLFVTGLFGDLR